MDYQTIIVEEKNAVGYLTFNRPKQLNSFNETMHQEVSKVMKSLGPKTVRFARWSFPPKAAVSVPDRI